MLCLRGLARSLPNVDLAGRHMGVEAVFPSALLAKRAKQSTLRNVESTRLEAARDHGRIAMTIGVGMRNVDVDLAGPQLDVFISLHVFDAQFSGAQPCPKVGVARHF